METENAECWYILRSTSNCAENRIGDSEEQGNGSQDASWVGAGAPQSS